MRLIDADALMSAVMAQDVVDKSVAKRLILQAPTVDVRIVRCEQCRYWGKDGFGDYRKCSIDGAWHRCSFWCAGGERREE